MSGKFVSGKGVFAVGAAVIAALAGCGSTYVARHGPAVWQGTANLSQAKAEVTNCVNKTGTTGTLSSSGRTAAINCMQDLVPPDKQAALKACLNRAADRDRVYTTSGREAFESKDAPACVNHAR